MATWMVIWTQTLKDTFEVEAETKEEAIAMVASGECGDVDSIVDNTFKAVRIGLQ